MEIVRSIKFKIYPNKETKNRIDTTLDCCRFVYNYMLDRNNKIYKRRKEHLNYYEMANLLPMLKALNPWLKQADSCALQKTCKELDFAYKKFFNNEANFPKYKTKKNTKKSYTANNTKSINYDRKNGTIRLPKLGKIKCKEKREIKGKICNATIIKEFDNEYYVSLEYKYNTNIEPIKKYEKVLGIDYKTTTSLTARFFVL